MEGVGNEEAQVSCKTNYRCPQLGIQNCLFAQKSQERGSRSCENAPPPPRDQLKTWCIISASTRRRRKRRRKNRGYSWAGADVCDGGEWKRSSKVCCISVAYFWEVQPSKLACYHSAPHIIHDGCVHFVTLPKTEENHFSAGAWNWKHAISITRAIFSSIALCMLTLWKALQHN